METIIGTTARTELSIIAPEERRIITGLLPRIGFPDIGDTIAIRSVNRKAVVLRVTKLEAHSRRNGCRTRKIKAGRPVGRDLGHLDAYREDALHAQLRVTRHRADVAVPLLLLEDDAEDRLLAGVEELRLLAQDLEVVRDLARVDDGEDHGAGRRDGLSREHELELRGLHRDAEDTGFRARPLASRDRITKRDDHGRRIGPTGEQSRQESAAADMAMQGVSHNSARPPAATQAHRRRRTSRRRSSCDERCEANYRSTDQVAATQVSPHAHRLDGGPARSGACSPQTLPYRAILEP